MPRGYAVRCRGDLTFSRPQLGLLDAGGLPVAGVEVARKVVDPFGLPSNTLMAKWKESAGLPL